MKEQMMEHIRALAEAVKNTVNEPPSSETMAYYR